MGLLRGSGRALNGESLRWRELERERERERELQDGFERVSRKWPWEGLERVTWEEQRLYTNLRINKETHKATIWRRNERQMKEWEIDEANTSTRKGRDGFGEESFEMLWRRESFEMLWRRESFTKKLLYLNILNKRDKNKWDQVCLLINDQGCIKILHKDWIPEPQVPRRCKA